MHEYLIEQEERGWNRVLGVDVDIKPLPAGITPEVEENLRRLGLELRFIPKLDLLEIYNSIETKQPKDFSKYLDFIDKNINEFVLRLENRYPQWRKFENLIQDEKLDRNVSRNLPISYWRLIGLGALSLPRLAGQWLAVETKLDLKEEDNPNLNKITQLLRLPKRFGIRWSAMNKAIENHKNGVLYSSKLPDYLNIRLLDPIEWNLLANREGWNQIDASEWTSGIGSGPLEMFAYPYIYLAGGINAEPGYLVVYPHTVDNNIGFRIAVELGNNNSSNKV